MKKLLYILCLGAMLSSCAVDTECRQEINVLMGVQLAGDSLRLAEDSVTMEHVSYKTVTGMSVRGAGRDSLIATGETAMGEVRLPLKKDADTTAFVFGYCGLEDTLYISYAREDTYISLACGCAVFANIDSVWCPTAHFVDSLQLLNTGVTTVKENHIILYFHKIQ